MLSSPTAEWLLFLIFRGLPVCGSVRARRFIGQDVLNMTCRTADYTSSTGWTICVSYHIISYHTVLSYESLELIRWVKGSASRSFMRDKLDSKMRNWGFGNNVKRRANWKKYHTCIAALSFTGREITIPFAFHVLSVSMDGRSIAAKVNIFVASNIRPCACVCMLAGALHCIDILQIILTTQNFAKWSPLACETKYFSYWSHRVVRKKSFKNSKLAS